VVRNRFFVALSVVLSSVFVAASGAHASALWRNCPVAAYEEAARVVTEMRSDANRGIFSGSDIMSAEVLMLDLGYCSGQVSKQDLCARKAAVINDYAESIRRLRDQDIPSIGGRQVLVGWIAEHATVCGG
jgi:hypothetical protein